MTLDIRGSLKNTRLSSNQYVVFEELISNAIDSFLIRKDSDPAIPNLLIDIQVEFFPTDFFDQQTDVSITCTDNGCGLGDEQLKAFLTKDTSYKDDLSIVGIGKCKGSGRIQFFHHFSNLEIESSYRSNDQIYTRKLSYNDAQKQIEGGDFKTRLNEEAVVGTKIHLFNLKSSTRNRIFHGENIQTIFSAKNLKNATLIAFIQRFISLENQLGDFVISFSSWNRDKKEESLNEASLKRSDLPEISTKRDVHVQEQDPRSGDVLSTHKTLTLSHYKLDVKTYHLPKNAIALCAKSSPVKDITSRYLLSKTEQNSSIDGSYHIILIEGDVLDEHVNEQRDNFESIPEEIQAGDMFGMSTVSYQSIYESIDDVIAELITPMSWKKDVVVQEVTEIFGVSEAMLSDTGTRIKRGDTARAVTERVLKKYQERVINETAEIFDLKKEIIDTMPDTAEFRNKINELSWKYAASLKNFDMANLSQLIVRRSAIVEVLSLACEKRLSMQLIEDGKRRKDESIIHSIFFPMRQDSTEVKDHDIWLLSEEYQYYDYISSDKRLAHIQWDEKSNLFDADIDEEFQKLLKKRADENAEKRPDIALFNKEGAAIIIEFKAPGVSMDDHVGDLSHYAHLLAAKSGGRLKKFYGYLIGDTLEPMRLQNWNNFPTGKGYFSTSPLRDPKTSQSLGELYSEILFYDDIVDRAKKRIGIYQEKLNLNLFKQS